jgi:exonuclease VII small subunit
MMKFLNRFRELRDINTKALEANRAILDEANRLGENAEQHKEVALQRLQQATEQAERLGGADRRNHYSESLTHAFRGRTA